MVTMMEFYRELISPRARVKDLQEILTIEALPALCASIDEVLSDHGDRGEVYCVWGQFDIGRELIRDGVRYSLSSCPHALAWTITCEGEASIVIHCTINKREHEPEFIDSIESFVQDWANGLAAKLPAVGAGDAGS